MIFVFGFNSELCIISFYTADFIDNSLPNDIFCHVLITIAKSFTLLIQLF